MRTGPAFAGQVWAGRATAREEAGVPVLSRRSTWVPDSPLVCCDPRSVSSDVFLDFSCPKENRNHTGCAGIMVRVLKMIAVEGTNDC